MAAAARGEGRLRLRARARALYAVALMNHTERLWRERAARTRKRYGARVVVSLTSHPPRFRTLAPTLKCLLMQSVEPDAVVLWLAAQDFAALPDDVLALQRCGLRIETAPDLGSYKKLAPALERWPGAFIATADDDVFYPITWLEDLLRGCEPGERIAACHRARRIALDADGAPASYRRWRFETDTVHASPLTFATGMGGVLYPPGSLAPEALDASLFMRLAPTGDDLWFYWMARRQDWRFRRIGRRRFVTWPGSQRVALCQGNLASGNDAQVRRLVAEFGFPGRDAALKARAA